MAVSALVTGCAGFIGSHLTESLLADGHSVLGVDCFSDNYRRSDKRANLLNASDYARFELVTGDLVELDVAALVEQVDVVYHLAAEPGARASWGSRFDTYTRHNVAATQRLLEVTRRPSASSTPVPRASTATRSRSPRPRTSRRARSRPTA